MPMDLTNVARAITHAIAGPFGMWTSVGHDEVIKMHYDLKMGIACEKDWYTGTIVVNTDSFRNGISITDLKWGYNSPMDNNRESTFLEVTIHDLAGEFVKMFLALQTMKYLLFFKGPDSYGSLWLGDAAIYRPLNADKADIQFNPQSGFIYKIKAEPAGEIAKSETMALTRAVTIQGDNYTDNGASKHPNKFEEYLKELAWRWNTQILEENKKPTAQIVFEIEKGTGANDELADKPPVIVVNDAPEPHSNEGTSGKYMQALELPAGISIVAAVQRLFQERWVSPHDNPKRTKAETPSIQVSWKKCEGGMNHIYVGWEKLHTTNTVVTDPFEICVGPDLHCVGQRWRGNLTSVDFGNLLPLMKTTIHYVGQGGGSVDQEQGQGGEASPNEKEHKESCGDETQEQISTTKLSNAPDQPPSINPKYEGWALMNALINGQMQKPTINIEMAYSFGFSPKVQGGLLKPLTAGVSNGCLDPHNGVDLSFYWYTSPLCQFLAKVPMVSSCYRIAKVIHQIGLTGNTTTVTLTGVGVGIN